MRTSKAFGEFFGTVLQPLFLTFHVALSPSGICSRHLAIPKSKRTRTVSQHWYGIAIGRARSYLFCRSLHRRAMLLMSCPLKRTAQHTASLVSAPPREQSTQKLRTVSSGPRVPSSASTLAVYRAGKVPVVGLFSLLCRDLRSRSPATVRDYAFAMHRTSLSHAFVPRLPALLTTQPCGRSRPL